MSRKLTSLTLICLILGSVFTAACSRKDQGSNEQQLVQSPVSPSVSPNAAPQTNQFWANLAASQFGVATADYQPPPIPEMALYSAGFSASLYDPLDGTTLGIANITCFGPGILGQAAVLSGDHQYIGYSMGSQIPQSGVLEFYLNTSGFHSAYNFANIIFTQCGYGVAFPGDIHLALMWNGTLAYGQWGPGWSYVYTSPLPANQWVKIRAEYGSSGMKLYVNDQLAASNPNRAIPISMRTFYLGTIAYYGPEYAIHGSFDEINAFSGTPGVKILSPASGSTFNIGDSVSFIGQKIGPVTNLQWASNIDGIFGQGLNATKSDLSPGTHIITLSGLYGGSQVSDSISLTVQGGKPRVKKISFQSMTGKVNLNRLYDREGTLVSQKAGKLDKFLEPDQWEGSEVNGEISQAFSWPISYVRSPLSGSLGFSRLKLQATFIDLDKSPSLLFDTKITGRLVGQQTTIDFPVTSVMTIGSTETTMEFESVNDLPDSVGAWNLELEWAFSKNGVSFGSQRTSHELLTTWDKPIENGYFDQSVPRCHGSSKMKAEGKPPQYLECHRYSCKLLQGEKPQIPRNVMDKLLNSGWSSPDFKYIAERRAMDGEERGLDRFLESKSGWCEEVGQFLRALGCAQGVDCSFKGAILRDEYKFQGWYLMVPNLATVALGGGMQSQNVWEFIDHAYTGARFTSENYYDLCFNRQNGSEDSLINDSLDVAEFSVPDQEFIIHDINPSPSYVDFYSEY